MPRRRCPRHPRLRPRPLPTSLRRRRSIRSQRSRPHRAGRPLASRTSRATIARRSSFEGYGRAAARAGPRRVLLENRANPQFASTVCSERPRRTVLSKGQAMDRIKGLSTGSKIVLGCGVLLFFSLFFTWQNLQVDFGRAGIATLTLDGWDFWGLLIGARDPRRSSSSSSSCTRPSSRCRKTSPGKESCSVSERSIFGLTTPEEPHRRRLGVDELPRACVSRRASSRASYLDWSRERVWERQVSRLSRSTRSSPGPS